MAFPTISAQQETNRKILEDLQLKKQLLQKGSTTIPLTAPTTTVNSMIQFSNPTSAHDITINSTVRSAWNQANSTSFGYFVPQDSVFGNSILPVLPRFDK